MATSKNFEVKNGLSVGGTERISSAGVGTFTDLNVTGTTTTIDTATLQVQDKNIVINYGTGDTSSTASGAGITIQDAVDASNDATLLWDASADEFDFSHSVTAPSLKSTGAATFDSTFTSTGLLLSENTGLYTTNASLSYYSATNGVYINGAGNTGWLRLNASGAQNSRTAIDLYGSSAGDYIKVRAANTDTMYFGAGGAGRVGIGTSNAAKPLHVYSSDNHPLRVESSDAYAGIEIKDSGSATLPPLHSALSNDHIFYAGHASARPEVMRIGSDGKVAINQASLSENLTVTGTGAFSGKFAVMNATTHGSFDFYNNGTSYFNGTTYVDDVLHITGSNAEVRFSGFRLDDNGTTAAGRLGFNRNPADGSYLSSSSYQRYQINGPGSNGDFLDIQNYNSSGSYQGSLKISGGNIYLTGSNDMRIKLSDSGITGVSDSNNTVNIRGDNDGMKLNAAGNGYILCEINGVQATNIASNGRFLVGANGLGTAQTEIKVPEGTAGLYVTTGSSGSVFAATQTLTCVNTLTSSNTWYDVAYVSHSPNIEVMGKSYQSNNVSYGGAAAQYTFLGHYGSVSATANKQFAQAMNGGDVTADLEYRYLNSGASSGSYRLQCKLGFSGGTHYVYTSIQGIASADMYEDD